MSKHHDLAWAVFRPLVTQRLIRMFGYSKDQAVALIADRADVAEHALSIELEQAAAVPSYIRSVVARSRPETKVVAGISAGILGLGLIGLLVWLLRKK